jgi:hypothetical protein
MAAGAKRRMAALAMKAVLLPVDWIMRETTRSMSWSFGMRTSTLLEAIE